jgi:hypothetical protein
MNGTKLNFEPFPGWPSKDNKPVLEVKIPLHELSEKFEFKVIKEKDDLDFYTATHYIDEVIGPVLLMRYDGEPSYITAFYVDSNVNNQVAVDRIKNVLGINDQDVDWTVVPA